MITVYIGNTGSGKSASIAHKVFYLLERNLKWFKKTGIVRPITSNMTFHSALEKKWNGLELEFQEKKVKADFIKYWKDPMELPALRETDIIWDEIATALDSSKWNETPDSLKDFVRQHEKVGVEIYGTSQRFGAVEITMRSLIDTLWVCKKMFGTRRPAATIPKSKWPWCVVWRWQIDPKTYEEMRQDKLWFSVFFGSKKTFEIYDTSATIAPGKFPWLRHIERYCYNPDCPVHTKPIISHR